LEGEGRGLLALIGDTVKTSAGRSTIGGDSRWPVSHNFGGEIAPKIPSNDVFEGDSPFTLPRYTYVSAFALPAHGPQSWSLLTSSLLFTISTPRLLSPGAAAEERLPGRVILCRR